MSTRTFGFDDGRLEKRAALLSRSVNPYPYSFAMPDKISAVVSKANDQQAIGEDIDGSVTLAGRIWAMRDMGKTRFFDLRDDTGKIQLYLSVKQLDQDTWAQLDQLDTGDLIGVSGTVFRTRSGELSIKTETVTVLAKSVVPIPIGKETDEKVYYRVSDVEMKYRERYVHWLLDDEDRQRIRLRGEIISTIRQKMTHDGFLEVSTPTIEFVYGGAEARPFETSVWALDKKKAFLRISPELYLKRYVVAGFDKVFTICQNFRNEGIDYSHNPEFTMMEWYEAFTDYNQQMERFENLVFDVCVAVHGSAKIRYQGVELDFTPPWQRLTVLDAIHQYGSIDAANLDAEQLFTEVEAREGQRPKEMSWGLAVARLFELICEEHLVQPTFVLDHPVEISPLTKIKRGDAKLVERFEPFAFRMELGNAYSELTDPVEQLSRLQQQRQQNQEDDYETHPIDADFVKAIGCGMPPTGGVGLGIDRLIMLLTDSASIRDIIPFPMLKPRQ